MYNYVAAVVEKVCLHRQLFTFDILSTSSVCRCVLDSTIEAGHLNRLYPNRTNPPAIMSEVNIFAIIYAKPDTLERVRLVFHN